MIFGFIVGLLRAQPTAHGDHRVLARNYLHAALETHVLALIVTWAVTLAFYPEEAYKHPKVVMLGAFNFCFGWDYPPGNYIGIVMSSFMSYFLWRYAILVNLRLKLHNAPSRVNHFAARWTYLHAFAANLFMVLWSVGPVSEYDGPIHMPKLGVLPGPDHDVPWYFKTWSFHGYVFLFYATASLLSYWGTYLESKYINTVKPKHTYFIVAFSISTISLDLVYFLQLYAEDQWSYGRNHPSLEECSPRHCSFLPGWLTEVVSWFWMFTLIAAPHFNPEEMPITESYRVRKLEDEDEAAFAGSEMH